MFPRTVILVTVCVLCAVSLCSAIIAQPQSYAPLPPQEEADPEETPEGYYAFIESAKSEPPQVRPPPYFKSNKMCPGAGMVGPVKSLNNLCGDLNKGFIPINPMRQNVLGAPYPFDLLKNKTLEFFSKTLPILKADETLPKVARQEPDLSMYQSYAPTTYTNLPPPRYSPSSRSKRSAESNSTLGLEMKNPPPQLDNETGAPPVNITIARRTSRKFCDNGGGILCMLYKAIQGRPLGSGMIERRDDESLDYRTKTDSTNGLPLDGPPTPCPAKVEYATPVFARNYQGVWRYVVQIPYEGYFTQTVEVTRCVQSKCHYMDGGCLSSPRWASLLVAEIFYPDTFLPSNRRQPVVHRTPVAGEEPPAVQDFQQYQQYLQKRAGSENSTPSSKRSHCDGVDQLGCFQVRLYYDWFLIPGSCKCWRPDYFSRYVRRKHMGSEL
ncbi:uncharacterized protein spz6 [Bemisia tabaci]|nr:PREDICTED: uncharacterized protein LOC109036501 [Bemisia tabaci]